MKVLLLTENWKDEKGGVQDYLENIVQYLGGVKVFDAGKKSLLRPRWYWTARKVQRRIQEGNFEMFLCGKALFEGQVGLYLKKNIGLPFAVFTYAMEIETWNMSAKERRRMKKVLQAADAVVYINEQTKKTLLDLGVMEKQLVKVWPGASERFFREVSPEVVDGTIKHYGLRRPYLLSVGRLIPRKGFDTLVEAFAKLDQTKYGDWQLVIAGSGPEGGKIRAIADSEFIGKSVKILDNVPDKHMPGLYHGADVFALTPKELPGDYEGFGIVYVEAAACGVPAIGTRTGGVAEAVINGETGLIAEPDDAMSVKEKMEQLLSDDNLRKRLGAAAKDRAWSEFQWRERVKPLREALGKIKKCPPGRRA